MVVDGEDDTPLEQTVGGAVMALTFPVGFGLMFAGVLPMSIGAMRWYRQRADDEPTEEAFERRVEDLLETEDNVPERAGRETRREPEYE